MSSWAKVAGIDWVFQKEEWKKDVIIKGKGARMYRAVSQLLLYLDRDF